MNRTLAPFARAGLLLAGAAMPLAPVLAQQAPAPADVPPPVVEEPSPTTTVGAPPPAAAPVMAPVVNSEPSGNEAPPPREKAERKAPAKARVAAAPLAAAPEPADEPGMRTPETLERPMTPTTPAAEAATATEILPVQVLPNETPPESPFANLWPWLLGAGALFAAVALILFRRQRRADLRQRRYERTEATRAGAAAKPMFAGAPEPEEPERPEEPVKELSEPGAVPFEPALASAAIADGADAPAFFTRKVPRADEPEPALAEAGVGPLVAEHELPPAFVRDDDELAPAIAAANAEAEVLEAEPEVAAVPISDDEELAPELAAAVAAAEESGPAAAPAGDPALGLQMRPVRAGVNEQDAVVEFELTLDNHGSAPARDVQVSAWLLPPGARYASDAERTLIPPRAEHATLPEVDPGQARSIEQKVALPTARFGVDALLPIVAAEARYRLADGSEKRLFKQFAVGVPLEGELAHFDLENPSGLHENVEARPLEPAKD
jgi:hypothetical protein